MPTTLTVSVRRRGVQSATARHEAVRGYTRKCKCDHSMNLFPALKF